MSYAERYKHLSIELDCAPGNPRPKELIDGVLAGTGLTEEDFDTGHPFFGHQTWVLKEGDPAKDQVFTTCKLLFKMRITALYNQGLIRYGTW